MRTFTIRPTKACADPFNVHAFDDCAVLNAASQANFEDADIFEDGIYKYSVRQAAGVVCIYSRIQPP